jgi:nucleotide-binding universal stress UspA family protein
MRAILVPIEGHAASQSALQTALLLGRMFDGYMEGFALGPEIPAVYTVDAAVALPPVLDEASRRELAVQGRKQFETFMQAWPAPMKWSGSNVSA